MSRLNEYLSRFPEGVGRERVRAVLSKQYRFATYGVLTMAEAIERIVAEGATLSCHGGTSKKRAGMRLPTAPTWTLFRKADDSGPQINKTAAKYANWLAGWGLDIDTIEAAEVAKYQAEKREMLTSGLKGMTPWY